MRFFLIVFLLSRTTASTEPSCGLATPARASGLSERVIGGEDAAQRQFPWQVQIGARGGPLHGYCGGTLLDPTTVVTAAHCVTEHCKGCFIGRSEKALKKLIKSNFPHLSGKARKKFQKQIKNLGGVQISSPGDLQVTHGLHKKEGNVEVVIGYVSEVHVNEGYLTAAEGGAQYNDIAVLKLETPVEFSGSVQPACLPSADTTIEEGALLTVSGFGDSAAAGWLRETPDTLQTTQVPYISGKTCRRKYYAKEALASRAFCAGHHEGGTDACQGDSGGPIGMYVDGRFTLVGVVSWALGCGRAGKPGVYTDVRGFLDFIEQHSGK